MDFYSSICKVAEIFLINQSNKPYENPVHYVYKNRVFLYDEI